MIDYRCKGCNAELEAPLSLAGWVERCPQCHAENPVPIRFTCHRCQAQMEVTRFETGLWRTCAKCGAATLAPAAGKGATKVEGEGQSRRDGTAQDTAGLSWGTSRTQNSSPVGKGNSPLPNPTGSVNPALRNAGVLQARPVVVPRVSPVSPALPQAELVQAVEWVGIQPAVRIGTFEIPRPMTYVLKGRWADVDEPSLLNPALQVSTQVKGFGPASTWSPEASGRVIRLAGGELVSTADQIGNVGTVTSLPYWPAYAGMHPDQRWTYLEWMRSGREQMPPAIGYIFLFFYGLERRVLLDKADQELVFDEVVRLRELHTSAWADRLNDSFENYSRSFLWLLIASIPNKITEDRIKRFVDSIQLWSDESLAAMLGWFVSKGLPLPAWAAYVVASQQPGSQRSVVIDRVNAEFRELFAKRYERQFGQGIKVRCSANRLYCYSYKPASAALPSIQTRCPSALGIKTQFKGLDDIWNSCIADLRKLSSKLRDGQGDLTPEAWEALPVEIRADVDHPMTQAICKLAADCTDDQNRILIPVSKLADVFKLGPGARLTPSESRMICRHVGFIGYRLEPDAYFTGNAYRTDEKVAAFLKVSDEATDHTRYNAAACMLQLGLVIASADGNAQPEELASISGEIERTFQLNAQEQRRLAALRGLLLAEGSDTKGLSQMLKALTPEIRHGIAKLLLAVVAADGVVTKEEIRAVRKCYSTIGFDRAEIDRAIDSLRAGSTDEPVTVQAGAPATAGEAIPQPPGESGFKLNRDTIAAIMKDTEEVARMLAAAMSVDQQPAESKTIVSAPPPISPQAAAAELAAVPANVSIPTEAMSKALAEQVVVATSDPTLPIRYTSFYQILITRAEWTVQEVEELARKHSLMRSGAIDELNEWAAEKFGGQLFVEDGPKLLVEQAYLN